MDTVDAPLASAGSSAGEVDGTQPTVAADGDTFNAESAPPLRLGTATATAVRSTILPKLELVENEPTLVVKGNRRYQELRRLGAGGIGEVVSAADNDIGRTVAIKRLRTPAKSTSNLVRFVEEIRTIGRLEHPNIIPIHDVGVDDKGEYYFVMKYVDGETLESIIQKLAAGDRGYHQRYGFEQRTQLFLGILKAVAFAHANGIVHRDIKPANVMIGAYGEVILMDWGIAKMVRGPETAVPTPATAESPGEDSARAPLFATQVGAIIGTPAYMSPEQASGQPVDERSDIYALCVLFHELLCLKHYLSDRTTLKDMLAGVESQEAPLASMVKSPHQDSPPMDLTWFVRAGLAKDPTKRYPSVQAMIERLERRAEGRIPIECPITLLKQATNTWLRILDKYPIFMVFVIAGLFLLLIGSFVAGRWRAA
ncbi:MAG TPA: serine/threonine-protein kinase [Pseudomonadota bacterium]|nr:serine/threonine-protein kinase [Pseudomonadota bacterium]